MTVSQRFSLSKRIKSFRYALSGYKFLLENEHNARLHLFFTFLVMFLGFMFEISNLEWIAILFAIGFVFVTEIFNTCIEKILDFISPQLDVKIKIIKDLSAAAVLTSAIVSVVIGIIIFLPKLLQII